MGSAGLPGLACGQFSILKKALFGPLARKFFTFSQFFYLHPNPLFSIISVVIAGVIPSQGEQKQLRGDRYE
jgi:hypothetical protein